MHDFFLGKCLRTLTKTKVIFMKPSLTIRADSKTSFAAALSLFTEVGVEAGVLQEQYSVTIGNRSYRSAGCAYQQLSVDLTIEQKFELMVQILYAKLKQHDFLPGTIALSGGVRWLRECTAYCLPDCPGDFWCGQGYESAFITALIAAYRQVNSEMIANNGLSETEEYTLVEDEVDESQSQAFSDRQKLSRLASYNPITRQMHILFNHKQKCKEWGVHLKQLQICDRFEIENSQEPDWKFELVLPMMSETSAQNLSQAASFEHRPTINNPKNIRGAEMPSALSRK